MLLTDEIFVTNYPFIILLHISDVNTQMRIRSLPNPPSIYEDVGYDSLGFPLEELAGNKDQTRSDGKIDQNQVKGCEANATLDLVSKEVHPYLDLGTKEVNHYVGLASKEVNQCMDAGPSEVNHNMYLVPREVDPSSDLDPKEVTQYMNMGSKEVNQCMDADADGKEVNKCMDLGPKEVDP